MILLSIDTATDRLSVALGRPGLPMLERHLHGARRHAAALLPMVAALLEEGSTSLDSVGVIAIADGPGSFTGLRVGAAAVKALARTNPGVTVWTASTLMVRAAGASAPRGSRVLVVTSALRGDLFAACYRFDPGGTVETILAPRLGSLDALRGLTPDLLVAEAPDLLLDQLGSIFPVPMLRGPAGLPRGSALLGLVGASGGAERIESLDNWEPVYGRRAEAQVKWEAAHGRSLPDSSRQLR